MSVPADILGDFRVVASDPTTSPEILQKLAATGDSPTRAAVAANPAVPERACVLLALDPEPSVREVLAARAASLVPRLAKEGIAHGGPLLLHTLEVLALDQAMAVRRALSTSLKDVAVAPPQIVHRLAQDLVQEVAEPILRYCLALSDDDLVALINERKESWARQAVAARQQLSSRVSDAVVATADPMAITTLIDNASATISPTTMEQLVEQSATNSVWQEPLARRPKLPPRLAVRLAEFVTEKALLLLRQRRDFDDATAQDVIAVVKRRMAWAMRERDDETGAARARRLFLTNELGEAQISDALSWDEQDFVVMGIALLAAVPADVGQEIFSSQSPRAVTALAWRAGLSMRCALQLQMRAANIPPPRLLNARDGSDYPMTEIEMIWQLEMFGIKA